jgi:hypothetical protein
MALHRIDFPVLARGMDREAPIGILNREAASGPLWRDMVNLVPHEGELRKRESVVEITGGLPTFLDSRDQAVIGLFKIIPDGSLLTNGRWLLVTQHEMFIGTFGAWTNITPRYATGTVSITNGTTALTGVGTFWQSVGIVQTQQILLDGAWYELASVASDTSATLATTYTGTTLAGSTYEIRRTFIPISSVFVANLNNDLYVAGMISSGYFTLGAIEDGGVLLVAAGADPLATITSADVSFLVSGVSEVESGIDYLQYNIRNVLGMTILADGRIVLLVDWFDYAATMSGTRVLYSSLTNVAVWTTSPGGFTDIVGYEGTGTAMTGSSRGVYVHFHDGIEVGDLTGAQDPPLRFRPSLAEVGAVNARLVQKIPGGASIPPGEVFIGADGGVYHFNGSDATPIPWASTRADLSGAQMEPVIGTDPEQLGFSRVDRFRRYVSFFFFPGGNDTRELRLYYDREVYVLCRYGLSKLTAASQPLDERLGQSELDSAGFFGTYRKDDDAADTNLLYEIRDDEPEDELPNVTGGDRVAFVYAESDALGDPSRRWAVSHVEVFGKKRSSASAEDITCRLSYGDGAATESIAASVTGSPGREVAAVFYPQTLQSSRRVQVRIGAPGAEVPTGPEDRFDFALNRMVVWLADVGEARTG